MRRYVIELNIPPDELLRYYRGSASVVVARDEYGRRVQFPASALRPFVTRGGVHGRFALQVDEHSRLVAITAL